MAQSTLTAELGAAVEALLAHRLRATLSAIGIVTGVGTVVAALAIAAGARRQAMDEIAGLGVHNIIVRATTAAADAASPDWLGRDDAQAAARHLPGAAVALSKTVQSAARASAGHATDVTVAGVSPSWRTTAGLSVVDGRWFDTRKTFNVTLSPDSQSRAAVIGRELARELFAGLNPLGQYIETAGEWRRIIGLVDSGRTVFVPLESLDVSIRQGDTGSAISQFVVRVRSASEVTSAAEAVRTLLAERHGRDHAPFEVIVPQELLAARLKTERRFNLLLLSMGVLALFVSGVGIMNIMVASVTERAAEIGIRRAFGARRSAIRRQFGAEAALLSAVAGLVGVPAGLAGATLAAWSAGWPIAVTATSVIIALALAMVVGLAAAVYPAHLAATMSPTDALRAGG